MKKEPIPLEPVSKFMLTAAIQLASCPKCNALPGYYCRMPSGRRGVTHPERVHAYKEATPADVFKARHTYVASKSFPFPI